MTNKLDIAVVVQRYGMEIIGGAETHARMIAERLAASGNYNVDVLTTTSRSVQWDNHFAVGVENINGVTVRRFRTDSPRSPWFSWLHQVIKFKNLPLVSHALPTTLSETIENAWYKAQGPYCPSLLDALRYDSEKYHRLIFFTYLYFPTAQGLPLVADRSILVPTLHDEPALHNLGTRRLFDSARLILANTQVERDLVLQIDATFDRKTEVVGVGIDVPTTTIRDPQQSTPYGLYLGRIGRAKRVHQLIRSYQELRARGDTSWELWLVGERDADLCITDTPGIRYLGSVEESLKWRLIQEAAFILNPSSHESLSLTTLEALAAGKPVVLSRLCPVFRSYAKEFSGVYLYQNKHELAAVAKAAIRTHPEGLEQTRTEVLRRFSWTTVLNTYHRALESL